MTGNAPQVTLTVSPAGPYRPGDQVTATASIVDADSYVQNLTGVDDLGATFAESISHVDPETITWSWASGATIATGVNPLAVPAPAASDTLLCVVVDAQGHSVMTSEPVDVVPPMLVGIASAPLNLTRWPGNPATTLFNGPTKGINVAAYRAVPASVLPIICYKDPSTAAILTPLLDALRGPIVLVPHHEPEADGPADVYRANFVAMADIVDNHPNGHLVRKACKLLQFSELHGANWADWVTGRETWILFDAYNPKGATSYPSPVSFCSLILSIGKATGKPVGFAECGSPLIPSDPDGAMYGKWCASIVSTMAAAKALMVLFWDTMGTNGVNFTMGTKPYAVVKPLIGIR